METLPADETVECDAVPAQVTLTATDSCGDATVTTSETRTDGNCPNSYTLTRTWIATDECNNTTTHVQTVTVQDSQAPTFTVPVDITIECDQDPSDLTLIGDVTDEADNCSSNLEATYADSVSQGECVNESIITRTWRLVDECGNITSYDQIV